MEQLLKYTCALVFSLLAVLEPTIPFAIIVFFAILLDCASAIDLNRRLKKQYPEKVSGKFESRYALKMFKTFIQVYGVVILLHWMDVILLGNVAYLNFSNGGAAIFCVIEILSILENISSGNGAKWAKIAQKVLVDKTKRHFDVDLEENKTNLNNNENG